MSDELPPNAARDPSFYEGRLMIDILAWNWDLRVSVDAAAVRPRKRFQGLDYGRDFTLHCRVRAPRELRGKTMKVTLSPFGPKVRFGRGGLQDVGRMRVLLASATTDFEATLMLPEEAIATTATSLASAWKHLQILTFDESPQGTMISAYFFNADIPPNLQAWADAE